MRQIGAVVTAAVVVGLSAPSSSSEITSKNQPSAEGSVTSRVGSWNVYYKALDDPFGSAAIIATLDAADKEAPFDFFGVIEAEGDTAAGNFSSWYDRIPLPLRGD
jgi:hypothetical protein